MTDSKLHWKEINHNEVNNENMQVNEKRMLNDNSKRISIPKRSSVSSVAFGTGTRKLSERSLHFSYPANDQNK